MRKIFSLLLVAAGMFCGIQNMQAVEAPANAKAYGYVQVGPGENPAVWGDAAAMNDYSAYLRLPDKNAKIKLTETIYADVFGANRHKSFHYNTGIVLPNAEDIAKTFPEWNMCQYAPDVDACRQLIIDKVNDSIQNRVTVSLGTAAVEGGLTVENFYAFTTATVNVMVKVDGGLENGGQEKGFSYALAGANETIEGASFRVLSANPSSKSAIDAVAEMVKTQVGKTTSSVTELCIKSGSYIQYGEERMDFFNDVVLGKNDMNMEKILRAISENTTIRKPGITGADTCKAVAFLIADSYVAARGRKAVLKQDMTVSVDASQFNAEAPIMKNALSTLWAYADGNKRTEFFRTLVTLANNLAAKIEGATVPVLVEFAYVPWDVIRGEEGVVVADDHELTPGEIGTFCSPYAYTQTRGGIVYSLVKRDAADIADVHAIELVEATYPLVAGQPYVFYATAPVLEGITPESATPTTIAGSHNGLIGYMGTEATLTLPYVQYQNCVIYQNHLRRAGNGSSIKSGLAYINLSLVPTNEPNPVAGRRMRVGNGTNATTDMESNVEAAVVNKVLVDGELVIIKNGVRYNAQGQIVK